MIDPWFWAQLCEVSVLRGVANTKTNTETFKVESNIQNLVRCDSAVPATEIVGLFKQCPGLAQSGMRTAFQYKLDTQVSAEKPYELALRSHAKRLNHWRIIDGKKQCRHAPWGLVPSSRRDVP